jgi:hypothetical protein
LANLPWVKGAGCRRRKQVQEAKDEAAQNALITAEALVNQRIKMYREDGKSKWWNEMIMDQGGW